MSNQRAGKTHAAAARDRVYHEMYMLKFFRACVETLEAAGEPASLAAFYFEQLEEHVQQGGTLPQDVKDLQRVFGV